MANAARNKVCLACTECKQRNYNNMKNKKNAPPGEGSVPESSIGIIQ